MTVTGPSWQQIPKRPNASWPVPNLVDYERARESFSWRGARAELDGLPGGRGLNIAYEAVDRHVRAGRGSRSAIRWLRRDGELEDLSYRDLQQRSNRFANVLRRLGVARGERVFCFTGRIPALYTAALGTLKNGSVFSPLFSAFGPEPARQRLEIGDARLLVTTPVLYRKKIAPIRGSLPGLEHVLLTGPLEGEPDVLELDALLGAVDADFEIPATDPEDPALLHFTSGTTGRPKGAVHVHEAVVAHHATGGIALDLHPDDVFWCTADPGWVTGTSYGIVSPLTHCVTSVVDEAEFDAERWYRTLQDQRVSVWYTAPTAVRMLMRAGEELPRSFDLSRLRFIASVGEPLNPEAVIWGNEVLGLPIHDNWWQTETGGIMISNYAAMDIRPGSMGKPLPGVDAAILARDDEGELVLEDGEPVVIDEPGTEGELALRPGWPSMFRGYLHEEERYAKCFVGGWYRSGDLARRDEDGYFWFVGRGDDVIKSAGHLIGPFEVESVLMAHPQVAEAGVIGKPDPVAGARIKGFVVLADGAEPSDDLRRDILGAARVSLGPAVAPKELDFVPDLPRTRSGKIMRRLLKARELGLPEGDLSTLEQV
jgi:acetyl-CoA synthetase